MKKTTLIAPFDDPLARAIAGEARARGRSIAALLPVAAKQEGESSEASPEPPVLWNPPSYVSARAAALEVTVRFGGSDEAVVVASLAPGPDLSAKPAEIEKILHDRVLSFFYLTRELARLFSDRGGERGPGKLVFVLADRGEPPRGPVEAAAFGAMQAFASSMAETASDPSYEVWTVLDSCPQDDLAAQHVMKILEASPDHRATRIVKFTGKGGIFNRI